MSTPPGENPCPDRIIEDAGGAFAMGAVGGSVFHFLKGLRDSPNGARITGGMQAARMKAPRVGGSFAVWCTLYSVFNCTAISVRQKDDPWNSIMAGAAAGGSLSVRKGLRAVGRSSLAGGCMLALMEGAGLILNRYQKILLPPLPANDPNLAADITVGGGAFPGLPQPAVSPAVVPSWFGSLFGKKEDKKPTDSVGMSEILESFQTPSPPIPSFEYN